MKWAIAIWFIAGFFLIRNQAEELLTSVIPGNWKIPIGIILVIIGFMRYSKMKNGR